jgi:hypothetical protein
MIFAFAIESHGYLDQQALDFHPHIGVAAACTGCVTQLLDHDSDVHVNQGITQTPFFHNREYLILSTTFTG